MQFEIVNKSPQKTSTLRERLPDYYTFYFSIPATLKLSLNCIFFVILQSKAGYVLFYQRKETGLQESLVEKATEHDGDIDMLNDGL